jgi:cytochrome c oxidase subunit IV
MIMDIANWPKAVQNGVVCLVVGWLGVYGFMAAFTYVYGKDGQVFSNRLILQIVILGVGLSFFVIQGKNWARIISVFGNMIPMLLAAVYGRMTDNTGW